MRARNTSTRGRRLLAAYALLVAVLAVWAGVEPWGPDPLDTSHALPTIGLAVVAFPAVVPLIVSGVGAVTDGGTFLALVTVLAWAEAAAVYRLASVLRSRRADPGRTGADLRPGR
ncbi:hypothetical protein AB0D08_15075 [Kitasatospora sp. NPDC048540]|uniref:hypothetical protein n=1 Tax=unclassified Kitasatospora TaxID=2633591 RepID=UPI000539A263|nr:hypothetical protein [Kitasatospora sp. MBT63]